MSVLPESALVAGGRLTVAGIPLADLAARHGTPLLVYDEATLRSRARAYADGLRVYPGDARAVFACKAQATVALLRVLVAEGLGMDVASEGELAFALAAGVAGDRVIVHGNNKSDADIRAALAAEAGLVVVDHRAELDQIEALATAAGRIQPVLVRVTPGIDADTHPKIATAHTASKFGLAPAAAVAALARAGELAHVRPVGVHVHLGSQIRDVDTYVEVAAWLAEFLDQNGLGHLPVLDLGGGLAIAYTDADRVPDVRAAVEVLEKLRDDRAFQEEV
jgi:diaminopimelate decarboxylase